MTSSLTRRLAAATCGLAAVLTSAAVAAPASAETFSKSDPAGDVESFDGQEQAGVTNGDIRRVRFEHARRNVTVRASFRDLARPGEAIQQYVRIDTPAASFQFVVFADQANRGGELAVVNGGPACPRADFRLDYGRDVFTLSVPRGCLDNPQWVRVGLGTLTSAGGENAPRIDDALQRGFTFQEEDIKLSPRLSRAGGSYTG